MLSALVAVAEGVGATTIYNGFSPTRLGGVTFTNFSGPGGTPVTFTHPLLTSKYPEHAYYAVPIQILLIQ